MKYKIEPGKILFYGVNLCLFLFWVIPTISGPIYTKCIRYHVCSRYMQSSGWPFHYAVDSADGQWRDIRRNLPLLWLCLLGTTAGHYLLRHIWKIRSSVKATATTASKSSWFRLVVGIIFLIVMHKLHAFIIIIIALVTFQLAMQLRGCRGAVLITWFFAMGLLLLKECYRWQYSINSPLIYWMFDHRNNGGMYQWQFPANFLVLRVISFSVDYHNACRYWDEKGKTTKSAKSSKEDESAVAPAAADAHRPLSDYHNIVHFLSYVLYTPLYMAGPVISYNAFIHYAHFPSAVKENVVMYGARWLICFGVMEYLTCNYPFFAVINSGLLPFLDISEVAVVCYMTLKMMWLKFLLIWRFFRLWALADGCNPPENMLKCMSNNCSLGDFWRSWHASFNQWILRYMYVPMGGKSTRMVNIWLIFLFVAVWHDIEYKLMVWGLLNAGFYLLEVAGAALMRTELVRKRLSKELIKYIGVFAGATYIIVLILVNLLGYSMLGTDGTSRVLSNLLSKEGFRTIVVSYYFLLVGVNIMEYVRELRGAGDSEGATAEGNHKEGVGGTMKNRQNASRSM